MIYTAIHECTPNSAASLEEEPPPKKQREMRVYDLCVKTYCTQKTLKRLRGSVHRQSSSFTCRVRDKRFYRKDNLRKHHNRKHADEENEIPSSYVCPICQKSFHYKGNYREHLKTHQPTSPAAPPSEETEEPASG